MANVIKLRKGLDINLKGAAAQELVSVKEPGFYSLVPDDYTGITPKVVVKEQEYVMAGGTLFVDKNHPEVKFVSPVSGVVTSVERGERRKVLSISIAAAKEQDYEEFGKKDVSTLTGEQVKAALLEALQESKEPTLPELLGKYLDLRREERTGWTSKGQLTGSVADFNKVMEAIRYLREKELSTVQSLDAYLDTVSGQAVSIRAEMKPKEQRQMCIRDRSVISRCI